MAKAVTESLKIPTIGIGAGPYTDGQVLVYHDLLGILHHPHYEKHVPSFCKKYSKLGSEIHTSLSQYKDEVLSGAFPTKEHSPYKMPDDEDILFQKLLERDRSARESESERVDRRLKEADEYEAIKLY